MLQRIKALTFTFIFSGFIASAACEETLVLNLQSAEELALKQNQHILATKELLEKAKQGRLETWSRWFPELEGSFQSYYAQKPIILSNTRSNFLTQLSLTQALFSVEKYHAVKIASLYEEQLGLLVDAAINDLLLDVRNIYYKIIFDYESIATAQEKVKLLVELSQKMEYNFQIGLATQYNVNQSKVAIASAQQKYYELIRELKVDLDALATFLGIDPGAMTLDIPEREIPIDSIEELHSKIEKTRPLFEKYTSVGPLLNTNYVPSQDQIMNTLFSKEEINQWMTEALQYRPDLRATKKTVEIAKQQVLSEKGSYYPSINFKGNYGGSPTAFVDSPKPHLSDQTMQWGVGLELKWLLFDSLGRERKIKKAKAEEKSVSFELQNLVQKSLADVRKQLFYIEQHVSDFITSSANVKLAKQTLYQSQEQLEIGYINIYDYQIAVDELIQTLNSLNRSKYELISSYYGLRHATGLDIKNRE